VSLVLDSSATLARVYPDETTPAIREVFETLSRDGGWVPALWRLEVANVLEMGVRRGRHDAAFRDATLADLASLPLRSGRQRSCSRRPLYRPSAKLGRR
jgi:hypothetical protein